MARVLNFGGYFLTAFAVTGLLGLISRYYPVIWNWYWVFFTLFLLTLIALGSYYGRKSYAGLLNTSESVLFGLLIVLFVAVILGGIAAHV
ncbi:MAG TPA: hypothetical protein DDZ60_10305 [Planktothrix sp. UBA10369]|nr:hypothetical protein [Planktothrix sp. UBA10369]